MNCSRGLEMRNKDCGDWGSPHLNSGAVPIVTAARFPAGATKVIHARGRCAPPWRIQGGGAGPKQRGGGENGRLWWERDVAARPRPGSPTTMSTKQVTCRLVCGSAGSGSTGPFGASPPGSGRPARSVLPPGKLRLERVHGSGFMEGDLAIRGPAFQGGASAAAEAGDPACVAVF